MNSGFRLQDTFWDTFVSDTWGRKPLLVERCFQTPLASGEELFGCLVAASDRLRAGESGGPAHLYRDDGFFIPETRVGPYLPQAADRSLGGYAERVTRDLDGRPFALLYHHLLSNAAPLWLRARDFLSGLSQRAPLIQIKDTLFLGNYESTPFGIHQDDVAVFMLVLEGRKRMLFWPEGHFDERESRTRGSYEAHRDSALILDAGPGDLLYWPSNLWHIGEPVPGLSASLNFGMAPFDPLAEIAGEAARQIQNALSRPERTPSLGQVSDLRVLTNRLPGLWKSAGDALQNDAEQQQASARLQASWLRHETRSGLLRAPDPLPFRLLKDCRRVSGCPCGPILWSRVGNHDLVCAANGHSFRYPAHPNITQLIQRLNTGEVFPVGRLVEEHSGVRAVDGTCFRASPDGIRTFLAKLRALRAITEVDESGCPLQRE